MNPTLEKFARDTIKNTLLMCTHEHRKRFCQMYSPSDLSRRVLIDTGEICEIVDAMPVEKLDWAMTQIENTLKKTKKLESQHKILKDVMSDDMKNKNTKPK